MSKTQTDATTAEKQPATLEERAELADRLAKQDAEGPEPSEYHPRARLIAGTVEDLIRMVLRASQPGAPIEAHQNVVTFRRVLQNELASAFDALAIDSVEAKRRGL